MLDKIEIDDPSIGKRLYFPCGRWLIKNDDDDLIEQELNPTDRGNIRCCQYGILLAKNKMHM